MKVKKQDIPRGPWPEKGRRNVSTPDAQEHSLPRFVSKQMLQGCCTVSHAQRCRFGMSDFFQHGLISTLHRLVDGPIIERNKTLPALQSVVLVLPCHYSETATPALNGIIEKLNEAEFLSQVVVSMNGIPQHRIKDVQQFWSRLKIPQVILRNDCPDLLQELERQQLRPDPGKGLNLWLAFGWLAANRLSGTIVVHDCDILNYSLDLPLALALPVARLGYDYCKGYYSRVQEELFGRVTRLFMIPLIRSLIRVLGHTPMLDFIDSFRYPLSGEYSMSFDTAMSLPVENGWAIEIGALCELHRQLDPETICQVDLAILYDHKHQSLDPAQSGQGLLRMASEIAGSLRTQLGREGSLLDTKTLENVVRTYETVSNVFVKRYQHVASLNALPFDSSRETVAVRAFYEILRNAFSEFLIGRKAHCLPPWRRMLKVGWVPDFSIIVH
jgi:glucosyl-3-phosphoglycerate synthase